MDLRRIVRHLIMTPWRVRRAFPSKTLGSIEHAIKLAEADHSGQIRFVVEGALHGARLFHAQPPQERALEVFSMLRIWDTEHRNGVLIYLLLADRAVEVVADRGVHVKVGSPEWQNICRQMEAELRAGRYESAIVNGIRSVGRHLTQHFPTARRGPRELPDAPVVLR